MMKKVSRFRFIPFIIIALSLLFLLILFTQTDKLYAWVPQGYCYGTGCYASGKRPGNFYAAAFSYGDTLVGFIFLMINIVLIIGAFIVGIFHIVKKEIKRGLLIFDIIFGGIYFTFGLVMSIFMAACCYIDDGVGVPICGFLSTFNILLLIGSAIALLILSGIAQKKDSAVLASGGTFNENGDVIPAGESAPSKEQSSQENEAKEEKTDDGKPSEGRRKLSEVFGKIFPTVGLGCLLILFFASSITRIVSFFKNLITNIQDNYWDNYFYIIAIGLFMIVTLVTTIVILVFFITHFTNKFDGHKTIKKLPVLSIISSAGIILVMMVRIMHYMSLDAEYRPGLGTEIALEVFCVLTIAISIVALSMKKPLLSKIFIAGSQLFSIIVLEILGFTELTKFAVPYEIAVLFLVLMSVANFFILPREEQ